MQINLNMKNGFEVSKDNWKQFIPYQAISSISSVKIIESDENYCIERRSYIGDNVCKIAGFTVALNNKSELFIHKESSKKYFPRFSKRYTILEILFSPKISCGLDEYSRNWLNHFEWDMEESLIEMKDMRNDLIDHFNKWKGFKNEQ